jgi:hypothetical protein
VGAVPLAEFPKATLAFAEGSQEASRRMAKDGKKAVQQVGSLQKQFLKVQHA